MQYACQSATTISVPTRQLGLKFFVQAACFTAGGLIEAGGRGRREEGRMLWKGRSDAAVVRLGWIM